MELPWTKQKPALERKGASYYFALGAGRNGLSGAEYDKLALEGYMQCLVAFACISKIASAAASVDVLLYKKTLAKLDQVDDNPLLDLLDKPNPAQSGKEFMRYLVSYFQLSSNAFVYCIGMNEMSKALPRELQLLNPSKVKVEPGATIFPPITNTNLITRGQYSPLI